MGLLDSIGALAGSLSQNSDQAKVAGGLIEALEQHPGGIQSIISSFTQNGMEQAAEKAGVSPQIAAMAMSTILPMVMQHFASGGAAQAQTQGQSPLGGIAQQLLSKFL
jgi:uncharacterized protein YidB (DUF937 family)